MNFVTLKTLFAKFHGYKNRRVDHMVTFKFAKSHIDVCLKNR